MIKIVKNSDKLTPRSLLSTVYPKLLKIVSLDNAIREFSLVSHHGL